MRIVIKHSWIHMPVNESDQEHTWQRNGSRTEAQTP
jgi:hypothetical protein